MAAIKLADHLIDPLQQVAADQGSSIEVVLDEIVSNYLRKKRHEKLLEEMERFKEQHSQLVNEYDGQFVGIYNGSVLAHDFDGGKLYTRLHQKFGNLPFLIVEVKQTPEQEFVRLHRRIAP